MATAVVAAGVLVAGPVLGAGQPDLATADADRAAADATALVDDELTVLAALADARRDADVPALDTHPEAARLARDWSQVMASAEARADLAACADLDDEAPGPVWHPREPHRDLGSPYLGDIGEVVGCFAEEVDAAAFIANRLSDPVHSAELLDPTWRHVGVGVVAAPTSDASFVAVVLVDDRMPAHDRTGVEPLLAHSAGIDAARGVLLSGSGPVTALLRAAPIAGGAVVPLATERASDTEPDPLLNNRVRARIDQVTGDRGRILAVGGPDVLSTRSVAELMAAGHRVHRLSATGHGVDPDAPVVLPSDVTGGPHAPAIGALTEARVLIGRGDRFAPQGAITRGQVATILARALELPTMTGSSFRDTDGDVHAAAIVATHRAGIVRGFADGTFRPYAPVTRGQLTSMIARAFALRASADAPTPADAADTTHARAIAAVVEAGIVAGFPDGSFRPGNTATRAQMATVVLNSLLLG